MGKLHQYNLKVQWTGNSGLGTSNYTSYERSHIIKIDGKADIVASSDPSFRGDPKSHNPNVVKLRNFITIKSVMICLIRQICVQFCFYSLSKNKNLERGSSR